MGELWPSASWLDYGQHHDRRLTADDQRALVWVFCDAPARFTAAMLTRVQPERWSLAHAYATLHRLTMFGYLIRAGGLGVESVYWCPRPREEPLGPVPPPVGGWAR